VLGAKLVPKQIQCLQGYTTLRHSFGQNDSRRYRIAGEMAGVEELLPRKPVFRRYVPFVNFNHPIDETEWRFLREPVHEFP
jgi:hypothetical protein